VAEGILRDGRRQAGLPRQLTNRPGSAQRDTTDRTSERNHHARNHAPRPRDIRVEARDDPKINKPTDAVIRLAATCVCGSDLWPYRGVEPVNGPVPMGHEYVGVVEEVGSDVHTIKPGQFVVGSFFASDNTCQICQADYQSRCVHAELMGAIGTQAEFARIPLADGTLVATPGMPSADLVPSLLAASDVLGTGWFAAVAADVQPGKTVAVVGDGAVVSSPSSPPGNSARSGSSR
jgi:threonine dehydrogenase-like Zn-dependent dehydrogenase